MSSREDTRTNALEQACSFCLKCGESLVGRAYTVAHRGKSLRVATVRSGHRGLHKECAEDWIERVQATPENAHEIPEIAVAEAKYANAVKLGAMKIDQIREEIHSLDSDLYSAVWRYHKTKLDQLKGKPERDVLSTYECPQRRALAAQPGSIESIRGALTRSIAHLGSALERLDKLSLRTIGNLMDDLRFTHSELGTSTEVLKNVHTLLRGSLQSRMPDDSNVLDLCRFRAVK